MAVIQRVGSPAKPRKWMSVHEMGNMLGLETKRRFQGDFSCCQCSQPCRDDIWENRELVKELTGYLVDVRLPEEAVPRCQDCGRVLVPLGTR